jgi:potassium-dependent mechanosensitive channel
VIIPNGDVLSRNIINWTLSNNHIREALTFSMEKSDHSKDISTDAIKDIILKNDNVIPDRIPEITITNLNSKNIELKILFWTKDFNKSDASAESIKAAVYQYLEGKGIVVL